MVCNWFLRLECYLFWKLSMNLTNLLTLLSKTKNKRMIHEFWYFWGYLFWWVIKIIFGSNEIKDANINKILFLFFAANTLFKFENKEVNNNFCFCQCAVIITMSGNRKEKRIESKLAAKILWNITEHALSKWKKFL